jgi:hypothetical protein
VFRLNFLGCQVVSPMGFGRRGLFVAPASDNVVVLDEGGGLDKEAEANTGEMAERLAEADEGMVFDRLVLAV